MDDDGHDDDGAGEILSWDQKTDTGMTVRKGDGREWGGVLGVHGFGGNMYFSNKRLREEAAGNNRGVCCRESNIKTLYGSREDGEFQ